MRNTAMRTSARRAFIEDPCWEYAPPLASKLRIFRSRDAIGHGRYDPDVTTTHLTRLLATASAVFACASATAQGTPLDAAWAGPVEAEAVLRFGSDGNATASRSVLLSEDDGGASGIALDVVEPGKRAAFAARTMIALPNDVSMALGPKQYLSFDVFVEADRACQMLIQLDEVVGDEKLRGILGPPSPKRGAWRTVTLNLLRNELHSDRRIGSTIMPDGTPLTRIGLRFDPRCRAGLRSVRVRNVRVYRQDVLARAPVDASDAAGQTALHRAAMVGDAKHCQTLLKNGADVNAKNKYLYTPLAHAVIAHDAATVKVLIDHGADVAAQRRLGFTPLYDAAAEGQLEIVELLLAAGASPKQKTQYGFEPLFTAVHHGHLQASERLLADERVDINEPIAGFMPLHVAAQGDDAGPHSELYERLIELGATVDACSAAAAGDVARLTAMIEKDPESAKTTILGGWTPLHDAVRNIRVDTVKLLLEHGADPNAISGDVDHRSTPLHWIGACVLVDDPQPKLAVLRLLVDAGAKLDVRDKHGGTPLDRARQYRSAELTKALRELGAKTGREVAAEDGGKER